MPSTICHQFLEERSISGSVHRNSSARPRSEQPSLMVEERPPSGRSTSVSRRYDTPRVETPSPVHSARSAQILPTETTADESPKLERWDSDLRQSTGIKDYTDDDAYSSLHEHSFSRSSYDMHSLTVKLHK